MQEQYNKAYELYQAGKNNEALAALQDLLEARFGRLPQSVTSHIASSSDSNILRRWTLFAYRAESTA